ncbi:MAG: VWA domain-containing protein [Verrucomicrobia bacterium]|nr:VWA domain-containing protein [Verrucomicrobiota bacterium]MCH8510970.1 VWA domain-containing protein [Kiritimatiellia bacterium]
MDYRFTVKALPADDNASWARIPLVGRKKLGRKQGDKITLSNSKVSVSLTLHQGLKEDANKMVVRIAPSVFRKLGVSEGDVVEIGGKSKGKSEICILAIDCSISMGDNGKIDKVKNAMSLFLDEKTKIKEDCDLVGCIGFAKEAWPIFEPSTSYAVIGKQLTKLDLQWGTNLVKPLELAQAMIVGGKGKKAPKYDKKAFLKHVILLADGNSEEDPTAAAGKCKELGIVVDTVGIIDKANAGHQLDNLKSIAKITGGRYVDIDQVDLAKLRRVFRDAAKDKTLAGQ